MKTFYDKLEKFGELVQDEVAKSGNPIDEQFSVVHPGVPMIGRKEKLTPELKFEQECSLEQRKKIMQLYRKAFSK